MLGLLDDAPYSITNADVRDALNRSAWYPSSNTWDPFSGTNPISPVAPCTQVGWGVVNMSNLEPIIGHLDGTSPLPDRPADVVTCMDTNQQIREAYWGDGSEEEAGLVPLQRAAERRW